MNRIALIAALLLSVSSAALAQYPGQIPNNTVLGNTSGANAPARPVTITSLTAAPLNVYIAAAGSDSNDCLAATVTGGHGPCATAAHAIDVGTQLKSTGGASLTLNIGSGSFTESIFANQPLPGAFNRAFNPNGTNAQPGQLLISGNGKANTTLVGNDVCATIAASNYATVGVRAITLNGNGSVCQSTLFAQLGGTINIYDDVAFGPANIEHIHVENTGSSVNAWYSYEIAGGAERHITVSQGGYLHSAYPSGVITLTGTPTFSSQFIWATQGGTIQFNENVTFVGTFIGTRYLVTNNGSIITYPSTSLTWLPGTVAGIGQTGGVYNGPATNTVAGAVATDGNGTFRQAACADLTDGGAGCGAAAGITQLTGDVTAGPGAGSQPATLATSGVSAATYTLATVTFDAKGRATSASNGVSSQRLAIGWPAGIDPTLNIIGTIDQASTVQSIVGTVATPVGATATASVYKAPSGTVCGSGTVLHSGSFNANGTAATNQTLTLTTTALSAGDRLCLVTTDSANWIAGVGIGGVTVRITTP